MVREEKKLRKKTEGINLGKFVQGTNNRKIGPIRRIERKKKRGNTGNERGKKKRGQ